MLLSESSGERAQTIDEQDSAISDLNSQLQRARGDIASQQSWQASAALRTRVTEVSP